MNFYFYLLYLISLTSFILVSITAQPPSVNSTIDVPVAGDSQQLTIQPLEEDIAVTGLYNR